MSDINTLSIEPNFRLMASQKKTFKPEKLLEPFKPENLIQALKNPDEVLLKGLKSLTSITGSITGINFNFYSKIKSEAKGKTELTGLKTLA